MTDEIEVVGLNAEETFLVESGLVGERECEICGGQGYYFTPTKVEAGQIVGDTEVKCPCVYPKDDYDPS